MTCATRCKEQTSFYFREPECQNKKHMCWELAYDGLPSATYKEKH